jgi:hypothetical protein
LENNYTPLKEKKNNYEHRYFKGEKTNISVFPHFAMFGLHLLLRQLLKMPKPNCCHFEFRSIEAERKEKP